MRDGPSGENIKSITDSAVSRQQKILKMLQSRMPAQLSSKINSINLELAGQRRDVSVLFADVANFTEISKKIGDEEIYITVEKLMQVLVDVVYKYEGMVDKFTGDGLMALFGLPINHENDPERAVRAALEMQFVIQPLQERLKKEHNVDFKLRVGINTGQVIAGKLGDQNHMEYTVIGDTVNLASRLENAANPGSILVSFRTYQRTRPIIDYKIMPSLFIKGIQEPIQGYLPVGVRAQAGQIRGLPGMRTPMIGRIEKLTDLQEIFTSTQTLQTSHFVFISGDAGLGKSRLISEFRDEIAHHPVSTYWGTCASYTRVMPYRVVADVIRAILQISELDPESEQREAVHSYLESSNFDTQEILPYLLYVLGISHPDPMLQTRLHLLSPDMLQRQIFISLRALFIALAQKELSILIFDDLHWVDQASRQFLEFLISAIDHVPVLLIFVSRNFEPSFFTPSILEGIRKHGRLKEIVIEPLSQSNSFDLLGHLLPSSKDVEKIKAEISNRAVGNPYYIEEIVRVLIEQEGLIKHDDEWSVTEKAHSLLKEIPGTLQDIIVARFDLLPETSRQTLQKASVLGTLFSLELLQILANLSRDDLLIELQSLESREFLIQAEIDSNEVYIFRHPLVQETIYGNILNRDRQKFHHEIGNAILLGTYWLPQEKNEIIAYHLVRSSTPTNALPHLLLAAEKASHQFANETAREYYRMAISLMDESETNSDRWLSARVGLGQAMKFLGEFEEGGQILEEALRPFIREDKLIAPVSYPILGFLANGIRELADIRTREGSLEQAVQLLQTGLDLLGTGGHEIYQTDWRRLMDRLAWIHFRQGKLEEAFKLADIALMNANFREIDDPITLASLHNTLGGIYWQWANQREAISHVESSLQIYQNLSYYWGVSHALTNLGILYFVQGKWSEAVVHFERADSIRDEFGYTSERPVNLKNLGELLISLGDYSNARSKLEQSRDISIRLGMGQIAGYSEVGLCRLCIEEKNFEEAQKHLEKAKELITDGKAGDITIQILTLESLIYAETGHLQKGVDLANQALQHAESGGFSEEKFEVMRVLGIFQTRLGNYELAESYLQNTINLAQKSKYQFRQAQAMLDLGNLIIQQASADAKNSKTLSKRAYDIVMSATDILKELGALPELQRAQYLLELISAPPIVKDNPEPSSFSQLQESITTKDPLVLAPEGDLYKAAILEISLRKEENVDDEIVFETISLIIPSFIEIIQESEGIHITKGANITAIFGVPYSHEDDPERAIETAINLSNFFQSLQRQAQLPFSTRFVITMGTILAGKVVTEGSTQWIVSGEAVQQAERIMDFVSQNRVWVSQSPHNATVHQYFFSSVPIELLPRSFEDPIFQLEGLRDQILPVRGLIGIKTPLVGRTLEIETMNHISQNLEQNNGGIIWLKGDPGIGKSRLMQEFSSTLDIHHYLIWRGNCLSRHSDRAFSLFSDLLFNAFDIHPNLSNQEITIKVNNLLKKYSEELLNSQIYFHVLLGSLSPDQHTNLLNALEPEQFLRQIFVTIRKFIDTVTTDRPMILLLDDLQWIDPVSADLLTFISSLVLSHPLLIIAAQRSADPNAPEKVLARLQNLYEERSATIHLNPFSRNESERFLKALIPGTDLTDDLIRLIIQQSGGNPYYIEEFIRMLVEKDHLRLERGKLVLNQKFELDQLSIPSSLEMLIRARVDSLPAAAKKVLQIASVIGHQFEVRLLEKLTQNIHIEENLSLLETRGMVNRLPSPTKWEFSHYLIENIVYFTSMKVNRRILHLSVATILETEFRERESDYNEELAYHYERAGDKVKALEYLILAGERSAIRYANEEALVHFTKASEIINELKLENDEFRWRIATGLGKVYLFIGNFDSSINSLQSNYDLTKSQMLSRAKRASINRLIGDTFNKKGDQEAAISSLNQALELLQDPVDLEELDESIHIYVRLGWSYFLLGDTSSALHAGMQAGRLAGEYSKLTENFNVSALVNNLLGGIHYRIGDTALALQHATRAKDDWDRLGYQWGVAASFSNIGILEVSSGNWQSADANFKKSLYIRKEIGDVEGVVITNNNLGRLSCDRGILEEAEVYYRDALSVAKPFGMVWQVANSSLGLAQVLGYQGQFNEAEQLLQEAEGIATEIGALDILTETQIVQAEILLRNEKRTDANEKALAAIESATQTGNRLLESWGRRVVANIFFLEGKLEEAGQALRRCWEVSEESGEKLEIGRVNTLAGQIDMAKGNLPRADKYISAAENIFHALGAERDYAMLASLRDTRSTE